MVTLPRLIIAAAASSAGKTTIATGLMASLRRAGHTVAGFKSGPDFIDPGYHALATGRPGRNLDAVLTSEELIAPMLLHGARMDRWNPTSPLAEIAIIEGVMGLFDGQLGRDGFASSAHIARLVEAPVVLVVDAAGSSRTAAAAALGLRDFDDRIRVAGVIVNRVGSSRHGAELASVFEAAGLPVLGIVPRSAAIHAPSRHLGLVPAAERAESRSTIDALADHIGAHVDLDAVLEVAASAPDLDHADWDPQAVVRPVSGRPTVAVMAGRAFTFRYAETEELLQAAGCEVVEIDPLHDQTLPAGLAGLYIGGGFPEMHAVELSANAALRREISTAVAAGMPTVAECAGLLYLGEHLDGHPMVGALASSARMSPRLTLGYRNATAPSDTLLVEAGTPVAGHEFHRTQTTPGAGSTPAWSWLDKTEGFSADPAHTGRPTLHASYLHLNWAGIPQAAQRFAEAAADFAGRGAQVPGGDAVRERADGIDLHHHGDQDLAPGLIDLAVNVRHAGPPAWLAERIAATIPTLGAYPDASVARVALAARHGVDPSMVLPTPGGAEAFALVARTVAARNPLVVHPQFTEPEAALRAVGAAVQRWLLPVSEPDTPSLEGLPAWADALFVGNPTNPTGWLHTAADLLAVGEGRLLVVDEAFMDAAGEAETLIAPHMPGRLVLRSLSKTWGLAGLRVGYIVGDPEWIARMAALQPQWPLSSAAVAAMVATSTPEALAEADRDYQGVEQDRAHLVVSLEQAGFPTLTSRAPFVLIDTSACGTSSLRESLAQAGFAVRRAETFPGLAPHWIRVRVPEPDITDAFVAALNALRPS